MAEKKEIIKYDPAYIDPSISEQKKLKEVQNSIDEIYRKTNGIDKNLDKLNLLYNADVSIQRILDYLKKTSTDSWLFVSTYTSLTAAITAIGATEGTLVIDKDTTITANTTIPATLQVLWLSGAKISGAYTLTINGKFVNDPLWQIFDSSITSTVINSLSVKRMIPQWWGAKGDYLTDDTVAVQSAFTTANATADVFLPTGGYVISASLTIPENGTGRRLLNSQICGTGVGTVLINAAPAGNATIEDADTVRGLIIRDMCFIGKTANPNIGIQLNVAESCLFQNLSFDTYGHGIYIVEHAMDCTFERLYFWWDILSDELGYTTNIRTTSVAQGFNCIKICNGTGAGEYWANHIIFDTIWSNGGQYGVYFYGDSAIMLEFRNCAFDINDVAIYLDRARQCIIRDCYLSTNEDHDTNRIIILKNCKDITVSKVHDDKYDPTGVSAVKAYGSIRIEGASTDNIGIFDTDCSGYFDIHSDVEGYAVIVAKNDRFSGGFTSNGKDASTMSLFYAENLSIIHAGAGSADIGTINRRPIVGGVMRGSTNYERWFDVNQNIIMNIDTTNRRVGFGTDAPRAPVSVHTKDGATNTIVYPLWLNHDTTGTPAAGLGVGLLLNGRRTDGVEQLMGFINAQWEDPTAGNEDGKLSIGVPQASVPKTYITLASDGLLTSAGKINVDDFTDATSATDGSLQTDGGLSVAKKGYFGDDINVATTGAYLIGGIQVVGARGAALTPQLANIDYATGSFSATIGVATAGGVMWESADDASSTFDIIKNLQTRMSELEARFKATGGHGLIADA